MSYTSKHRVLLTYNLFDIEFEIKYHSNKNADIIKVGGPG
jgi:hypothetical protein